MLTRVPLLSRETHWRKPIVPDSAEDTVILRDDEHMLRLLVMTITHLDIFCACDLKILSNKGGVIVENSPRPDHTILRMTSTMSSVGNSRSSLSASTSLT